jgi:hypothetical protein
MTALFESRSTILKSGAWRTAIRLGIAATVACMLSLPARSAFAQVRIAWDGNTTTPTVLAVWSEVHLGRRQIRGAFLNAPLNQMVINGGSAFEISSEPLDATMPAVSSIGPGLGFAVVWNVAGTPLIPPAFHGVMIGAPGNPPLDLQAVHKIAGTQAEIACGLTIDHPPGLGQRPSGCVIAYAHDSGAGVALAQFYNGQFLLEGLTIQPWGAVLDDLCGATETGIVTPPLGGANGIPFKLLGRGDNDDFFLVYTSGVAPANVQVYGEELKTNDLSLTCPLGYQPQTTPTKFVNNGTFDAVGTDGTNVLVASDAVSPHRVEFSIAPFDSSGQPIVPTIIDPMVPPAPVVQNCLFGDQLISNNGLAFGRGYLFNCLGVGFPRSVQGILYDQSGMLTSKPIMSLPAQNTFSSVFVPNQVSANSQFFYAWDQGNQIFAQVVSADPSPLGTPVLISTPTNMPALTPGKTGLLALGLLATSLAILRRREGLRKRQRV